MKQLKLLIFLICFALGFNSSEGKKCCVSRAYAMCAGWPQIFGKTPLLLEKKIIYVFLLWHVGGSIPARDLTWSLSRSQRIGTRLLLGDRKVILWWGLSLPRFPECQNNNIQSCATLVKSSNIIFLRHRNGHNGITVEPWTRKSRFAAAPGSRPSRCICFPCS